LRGKGGKRMGEPLKREWPTETTRNKHDEKRASKSSNQ